jgi:hypothetical protein
MELCTGNSPALANELLDPKFYIGQDNSNFEHKNLSK